MRKILKAFYFGNITPWEKRMDTNSELYRATGRAAQYEHQLEAQLNETEKALLTEFVKTQHEIDSLTAMENFIYGFRLGVRMMVECMDENDGDLKGIGE